MTWCCIQRPSHFLLQSTSDPIFPDPPTASVPFNELPSPPTPTLPPVISEISSILAFEEIHQVIPARNFVMPELHMLAPLTSHHLPHCSQLKEKAESKKDLVISKPKKLPWRRKPKKMKIQFPSLKNAQICL